MFSFRRSRKPARLFPGDIGHLLDRKEVAGGQTIISSELEPKQLTLRFVDSILPVLGRSLTNTGSPMELDYLIQKFP